MTEQVERVPDKYDPRKGDIIRIKEPQKFKKKVAPKKPAGIYPPWPKNA